MAELIDDVNKREKIVSMKTHSSSVVDPVGYGLGKLGN